MNNPQAFPCDSRESITFAGMTLRDYFAARAMQGLVIHKSFVDLYSAGATAVAQQAYLVADAMLKAREQT
jgi:hypothetical protein